MGSALPRLAGMTPKCDFCTRLILIFIQLASNYAQFFEKLTSTLEQLSQQFPQCDEIVKLCQEKPPSLRLKSALQQLYVDLLRFFQSILRVFTKKDGGA